MPGLDGLQGRPGDQGKPGVQGEPGVKGERGRDGRDGRGRGGHDRGMRGLPGNFIFDSNSIFLPRSVAANNNRSVFDRLRVFETNILFKLGSEKVRLALQCALLSVRHA